MATQKRRRPQRVVWFDDSNVRGAQKTLCRGARSVACLACSKKADVLVPQVCGKCLRMSRLTSAYSALVLGT